MAGSTAAHTAVKRELLVRYLDAWAPVALHGARRATFLLGYGATVDDLAVEALRVFGEFADLLARHKLTVVVLGPDTDALAGSLDAVRQEMGAPPGLIVRPVTGPLDTVRDELAATGAFSGPVLAYLDMAGGPAPSLDIVTAVARSKAGEVLVAMDPLDAPELDRLRKALHKAGFGHVTHVELVDNTGDAQLLVYATASAKNADRFKDALWAVDEYAGVRYRDPRDREHALLDISLSPHLGPLRRALLDRVSEVGECSAADLREYAVAETVYRAADATKVLTALAGSGAISREPSRGRLTPETRIRPATT
jgi:hypothetical protein